MKDHEVREFVNSIVAHLKSRAVRSSFYSKMLLLSEQQLRGHVLKAVLKHRKEQKPTTDIGIDPRTRAFYRDQTTIKGDIEKEIVAIFLNRWIRFMGVKKNPSSNDLFIVAERAARDIVSKYPSIAAGKIWEGNIEDVGIDQNFPLIGEVPMSWKTVQIFMKEGEEI